jgi:hypothetical protein
MPHGLFERLGVWQVLVGIHNTIGVNQLLECLHQLNHGRRLGIVQVIVSGCAKTVFCRDGACVLGYVKIILGGKEWSMQRT